MANRIVTSLSTSSLLGGWSRGGMGAGSARSEEEGGGRQVQESDDQLRKARSGTSGSVRSVQTGSLRGESSVTAPQVGEQRASFTERETVRRQSFEAKVEMQLDKVKRALKDNKNKAIGGLAADLLTEIQNVQEKQHQVLSEHIRLETTLPVGSISNPYGATAEDVSQRMVQREDGALVVVEGMRKLDEDIQGLVQKIEQSKLGDKELAWNVHDRIEVSDDDDSSDDFQSAASG